MKIVYLHSTFSSSVHLFKFALLLLLYASSQLIVFAFNGGGVNVSLHHLCVMSVKLKQDISARGKRDAFGYPVTPYSVPS